VPQFAPKVGTRCVFSCDKPNVMADAHKSKTALPTLNTVRLMHPSTRTGRQKLQTLCFSSIKVPKAVAVPLAYGQETQRQDQQDRLKQRSVRFLTIDQVARFLLPATDSPNVSRASVLLLNLVSPLTGKLGRLWFRYSVEEIFRKAVIGRNGRKSCSPCPVAWRHWSCRTRRSSTIFRFVSVRKPSSKWRATPQPLAQEHASSTEDTPDLYRCPKCGGPMKVIERLTPSTRRVPGSV
jgi:hypothetical protein